jgi:hypothetical protein
LNAKDLACLVFGVSDFSFFKGEYKERIEREYIKEKNSRKVRSPKSEVATAFYLGKPCLRSFGFLGL